MVLSIENALNPEEFAKLDDAQCSRQIAEEKRKHIENREGEKLDKEKAFIEQHQSKNNEKPKRLIDQVIQTPITLELMKKQLEDINILKKPEPIDDLTLEDDPMFMQ